MTISNDVHKTPQMWVSFLTETYGSKNNQLWSFRIRTNSKKDRRSIYSNTIINDRQFSAIISFCFVKND